MQNIQVIERQTLFDIAIQQHGTVETLFEILGNNPGLEGITDRLEQGQILKSDDTDPLQNKIVRDLLLPYKIASGEVDDDTKIYSYEYEDQYS